MMVCCVDMRDFAYCIVGFLLLWRAATAQAPGEFAPGPALFNVFVQSTPIGFEQVELSRTPNGWLIRSRSDLSAPIAVRNQQFEVEYDETGHPLVASLSGVRRETPFSLSATFGTTDVTIQFVETGLPVNQTNALAMDAVVLPDYAFAGYEALAFRLASSQPGDEIPVYVPPRGETVAQVNQILSRQIQTGTSTIVNATVYRITFLNSESPLGAEVWTDASRRLLRVTFPSIALDVARSDIATVGTRVRRLSHAGDEDVRIPAEGFTLATTITTPVDEPRPNSGWPAVVLVSPNNAGDRDGTINGTPILGQLALALADQGFLVARYDRRGIGQSGGRPESANVEAHADDARAVVRFLDDRDDVDEERVSLLGYAEGGWTALLTAARERRIDQLVLLGTPASTGPELIMEQQRAALEDLGTPDSERSERIDLQRRINAAVLGDGPWDSIPPRLRRRAETTWYRSFLEFNVADTVRRTRQPILILHGSENRQIAVEHADRLLLLAHQRRRDPPAEQIILEGLDHSFMDPESPVATDRVEYGELQRASISLELPTALGNWLRTNRD